MAGAVRRMEALIDVSKRMTLLPAFDRLASLRHGQPVGVTLYWIIGADGYVIVTR